MASISCRAVFDDMLYNVVPVLIRNQTRHAIAQLRHDCSFFVRSTMLKAPLDDTTAVVMRAQRQYLRREGIEDELDRMRLAGLNCPLDDVVSVLILHASQDVVVQFTDELILLIDQNVFQRLLRYVSDA